MQAALEKLEKEGKLKRVVFTEALPKNPSGKLLKRQLRQDLNQA